MLNCVDDLSADNAHPAENSATSTKSRLERVPVDNSASASGSGTNTSSSQHPNVENSSTVAAPQPLSATAQLAEARRFFAARCRAPLQVPTRAEFFLSIPKRRQNDIIISHQNDTMRKYERLWRWVLSPNFKRHFEFTTAFNDLPVHIRWNTDLVIDAFMTCGTPSQNRIEVATSRWPVQKFGYCHPYLLRSDLVKDRYSFRWRAKFCFLLDQWRTCVGAWAGVNGLHDLVVPLPPLTPHQRSELRSLVFTTVLWHQTIKDGQPHPQHDEAAMALIYRNMTGQTAEFLETSGSFQGTSSSALYRSRCSV